MTNDIGAAKYFLGANSTLGFVSRFDQLYNPYEDWFAYIIKGGPGTGKSSLIKRIATTAISKGIKTELIYCSSDPGSLDGVIFPSLKISIADGTFPHTLDPIFPGASDTLINLSDYWDPHMLYEFKNEIKEGTQTNSFYHKKAKNYLAACKNINDVANRIIEKNIVKEKILSYSENISKKIFKKKSELEGIENIRFLSGITPDGVVIFEDTLNYICDEIYVLDDEYGISSSILLSKIKENGLNAGFDIITSYCPMDPYNKIEYLMIPEIKIGFAVSNNYHPLKNIIPYKTIHCKRFMYSQTFTNKNQLLKFNKKIKKELLDEAIYNLKAAKSVHDNLEKIYVECMDFNKIDKISEHMIKTILL